MANPWQHHRFGRSICRQKKKKKKKWLFLVANSNSLRKTTLGKAGGSVREYNLSRQMFSVSSSGTFVNREETSKEHINYSIVMLVLFGPIREAERVFDSVLVGRDWLKYRNKVRSEIVVIGVNR